MLRTERYKPRNKSLDVPLRAAPHSTFFPSGVHAPGAISLVEQVRRVCKETIDPEAVSWYSEICDSFSRYRAQASEDFVQPRFTGGLFPVEDADISV